MFDEICTYTYSSPAGTLKLCSCGDALCMCDWISSRIHERNVARLLQISRNGFRKECNCVIHSAIEWLEEYFAGHNLACDVPLLFVGTDFKKRVWHELMDVSYGTTISYGALSRRVGIEKGVRAVAAAVGSNPLSIFVPCHRVVGADGTLTGYAGGLDAKRFLLDLEKENK